MTSEMSIGLRRSLAVAFAIASIACNAPSVAADELAPDVDHHQHLLSPQAAALLNSPQQTVDLPAESHRF